MSTFTELADMIEEDLARTNIRSRVETEIQRAIKYYQNYRFYFNESSNLSITASADGEHKFDGATIVTGDVTLALADVLTIDEMFVRRPDNQRYRMTPIDNEDIQFYTDASASQGEPYWYSRSGDEIWVYPYILLANVSTLDMIAHYRLSIPSGSTSNAWTEDAEQLIRCRAKHFLYAHKIMDAEKATLMRAYELDALNDLVRQTNKKTGTKLIKRSF